MLRKKGITLMLMMFLGIFVAQAQTNGSNKKERGEKAREMKMAFFAEALGLTDSQAEKFWPIYDKYAKQRRENRKAIRAIRKTITDTDQMTEAEFVKATNNISELKIREIKLNKEYINECLPILGVEKTIKLLQSEKDFRKLVHEKRVN